MSSCNATLALLASRRSTSHTLTQQQQQQLPLRRFASLPVHEMMGLPALSPTMEKGNLVAWRKKEGDKIKAGEIIAEIETDKAVMEFEAQDNAVLAKILVQAGTNDLAVGTPIAITVKNAADVAAFANASAPSASAPAPAAAAKPATPSPAAPTPAPAPAAPAKSGGGRALPAGFALMGMPALSPTMESGTMTGWRKKAGDKIKPGEIIADVETDKASMEFEAQDKCVLAKILVPGGTSGVRVGAPIAIIASADSADVSQVASFELADVDGGSGSSTPVAEAPKQQQQQQPQQSQPQQSQPQQQPQQRQGGGATNASPFVRAKLRAAGVSLGDMPIGSGPHGRLIERDIAGVDLKARVAAARESSVAAPKASTTATTTTTSAEGDYDVIPHSNIRRVTAQRLTESKQQVPHYYLTMEMNVDSILALRERLGKSATGDAPKPSLNDFVVRASAAALRAVPDVNASWTKDAILRHRNVDICVAVATDRGLLTPIVHDADQLGVNEIAATTRALATRAREGKLKPHEFQGGTFTISNLGMFGITQFTAVINPPQAAILAVGTVDKRVVPGKDGGVAVANVLTVTLSCDHRVIDGAIGATWLQAFKRCMEDPINMIL